MSDRTDQSINIFCKSLIFTASVCKHVLQDIFVCMQIIFLCSFHHVFHLISQSNLSKIASTTIIVGPEMIRVEINMFFHLGLDPKEQG